MIQLQVINYMLSNKTNDFVTEFNITPEFFTDYLDEFNFIQNHYTAYNNIPDSETFALKFSSFEFINVNESPKYLYDALHEEKVYREIFELLTTANTEIVEGDSRKAVELIKSKISKLDDLATYKPLDLYKDANERFLEYCDKKENKGKYFISTGLQQLDDIIGGWSTQNDLVAIAGRPGKGKSWWLDYFVLQAAKAGKVVGLYTGEMSASTVGGRIDTFESGISNFKIAKGHIDIFDAYKTHIQKMASSSNSILVVTPQHFGGAPTPAKLKTFCEKFKIEVLAIDQYSLLEDDKKHKNRNEKFESISKDLKSLQSQLQIPILCAAQLNRSIINTESGPGTESLAGSDRISQDSSVIISLTNNQHGIIDLTLTKVREGGSGGKLSYAWDIDKGKLEFIPCEETDSKRITQESKPRNKFEGETINF